MSFFFKLSIFLTIFVAWLWKVHPDILITLAPKHVDFELLKFLHPSTDGKNMGITREPMVSILMPTEGIDKNNIREMFHPDGFPTLVKNVLTTDQDKIVNEMTKRNKGRDMRMLSFKDFTTPHFSPSCDHRAYSEVKSFDDYSTSHLFSNVADNHSYFYAGFEAITDAETVNDITGLNVETLGDYKQNNLFTSNFPKEILTATLHCAPIDSLTLQLIGTKTWFFVSPEDLANVNSVPMPTSFNLPMTDDELLSKVKNVYVLRQEAGDVMYFGPHWCHAVSTAKGPNLMMNMRYFSFDKIKKGPIKLTLKILIRRFLSDRGQGKNPQENKALYPGIYNAVSNWFDDCGESSYFMKLYRRALNH